MIILGIDPGFTGALAVIEAVPRPRLLAVIDVPTYGVDAKRRVKASAVLAFLQKYEIHRAFIERAQAMPDQGSSSGFIYGRCVGALEFAVEGMQIRWQTVEPTAWKTTHGLIKTKKKDSLERARKLFGMEHFEQQQNHGRAEAALIAWHGMMSLQIKNLPAVPALPKP